MKLAKLLCVSAIIFVFSNPLSAQTAPNIENGFKSFGSYQGGEFDTVNLQTGNLIFHVPLFSYPQRGRNLSANNVIAGNSKNWQVGEWIDSQQIVHSKWMLKESAGVSSVVNVGSGVFFSDPSLFELHRNRHLTTDFTGNQTYTDDDYAIATSDGAWHWLSGFTPSGHMMTMDGSGIQLILTRGIKADYSDDTATVIFRDGTRYFFSNFSVPMPTTGQGNNLVGTHFQPELVLDAWGTTQTAFDAGLAGSGTDANGNVLALPTDTLGRNVSGSSSSTSNYLDCATTRTVTSASIFNAPGPDGRNSTFKICVTAFIPTAAFSQANVDPPSVPTDPRQLNSFAQGYGSYIGSILMPDGNHWLFDYDAFGNVTKITLPTGGSITYQWTEIPDTCEDGSLTRVSRAVSSRTVNDNNGNSYPWTYNWGTLQQDGSITNYALDPNGNESAHVFRSVTRQPCDFYEVETRSYKGTHSSGMLIKTVDTHYVADLGFSAQSSFAADVVPDVITTTLPNGRVSKVVRQYDTGGSNISTYGKVTNEKVYDYGNSGPGALLRETVTTYQWQANPAYLDAGFFDLPASIVVKDGAGCAQAETDYTYDESNYLTTYPGTLPTGTHGTAPGGATRGNLTTTTKWLAATSSCNPKGGTAITSHTRWYDTGVPYQTLDPLGHTTTLSYDSAYAGAYVTQTCSPATSGGSISHCVSGTYDFMTGLLESFTNENAITPASGNSHGDPGHTSTYTYDTSWRLTTAQSPPDPANNNAPSVTSFTPSAANVFPLSVQHQRSITTALMDSSTSYFDGLARVTRATHDLPNGTATVLTNYDGLGQVLSVTNPFFSTSDATYGVTSFLYDPLGRVTRTTKQDGSISSVAYDVATTIAVNADCVQTRDEAGNQRGACSDALGRLVEVDEPNPGNPINMNYSATLLTDGNFVLENAAGTGVWSTGTFGTNASSIYMQDDGNLVLYIFKWQAGVYATPSPGPFPTASCSIGSYLVVNQRLNANQCIASPHGQYLLYMAPDGNFYIYDLAHNTGTWGPGTYGHPGAYAMLQSDGNFVVYDANGVGIWSSGTYGTNADRLNMEDDGRVIIYKSAWNSGTSDGQFYGTAIAHPGCDVGNSGLGQTGVLGTGSCLVSPNGRFELLMQGDGNLVIYDRSFTPNKAVWSTGTGISAADPGFAMRTFYSYDALGNLLRVDQKGTAPNDSTQWRTRTFTYDSLSRLLTANNPESGTITYSYDLDGNLLQKTSPAPNQTGTATQTVSYCYDALHRVTGKGYGAQSCPLATPVVTYVYDSGTNAKGKLTSLTDQAGTASYTYDILGRLTAETRTLTGANNASISKNLSYEYNLDGSLYKLHYPSGNVVTYAPGTAGLTLSAIDSGNAINYVKTATYGPDSALTGFISGNSTSFAGITNAFSYNKRLQPINMSANAPSQTVFSIGYDFHLGNGTTGADNGNVYGITNYKDQTRNQTFTYDALNRLASARNAGTDCTVTVLGGLKKFWGNNYAYDAWGNLVGKSLLQTPPPAACAGENLSVTADAHNWIHASGTDYLYDAAGNMTRNVTPTVQTYTHDQENRLTGAAGYVYTYDADSNRARKSTGGTGTLYWYMTPGIVGESDLSGNLTDEYVFFDGERVARKSTNGVFYYFSDHLKTASVITDSSGNIKSESDFYPWGGELQFGNNDSNHYKFTGKERDAETQLDYFGARYYSNGLGRFVIPDWAAKATAVPYAEFSDPQSLNLYTYVRNTPTTRYDVDGHCPDGICYNIAAKTPAQIDHLAKATPQVMIGQGKALVNTATSTVNMTVNMAVHNGVYVSGTTPEIPQLQPKNEAQAAGMISMNGALAATGVVTGGLAIVDLTATVTAPSTINLFRAVGPAEAESIESLGAFSPAPNGTEFKGFFFNQSDAESFGQMASKYEQTSVYSTEAPTDLVNSSPPHSAAGEGPGTLIRNEKLNQLSTPKKVDP